MSYIVCRNCKNVVIPDESQPLNFDKCHNCGHVLEYARDNTELNCIMNNIEIPKIAYHKICAKCHSLNPRQTGMCLFCGSTRFLLQYDANSVNNYNKSIENLSDNPEMVVMVHNQHNLASLFLKILSVIVGLFDFLFFFAIGIEYTLGLANVQKNPMLAVSQNYATISLILVLSLLLAGFLISFVLPRVSYKDSFKLSSLVGIIVGLSTVLVVKDIPMMLIAILFCGFLSGLGGFIGELLVHKILNRMN
ncbi:hypothetical protein [Methanosphaera sp. BMS]|uniref:hypothetical protein n=1 Tax=Methanosphaera sp. BMS TaxID=1789762 RepID=UPI000DC1F711|nr:hypothetical protein [Methanosphaera sp. BMS]AWX32527.1 hypothetical protein AW729_05185 [Methanosphaera sp. BMS]